MASGSVDSHGNFSATTTVGRKTSFVATWSGDAAHPAGGTSATISVLVRAAISERLTGYYAIAGRHHYHLYHFRPSCPHHHTNCPIYTATVLPNHAGKRVSFTLQLRYGGRWHTALTFSDTLGKHSSAREGLIYRGRSIIGYRTRIRATFKKDADHLANTTPWSYFEVTA